MITFASLVVMSALGIAICAALLKAASPAEAAPVQLQPELAVEAAAPRFFAVRSKDAERDHEMVPIELLISRIERHVQLEQAAAETFLDVPTTEALQSRTTSALLN